jgi:ribonuclease HI
MELCLFDECLTNDKKDWFASEFEPENYVFSFFEQIEKEVDCLQEKYTKLNLFVSLRANFLSKQFVSFVNLLIDKKLYDLNMNVIVLEKLGDESKIAIEWLVSLKTNYFSNLNIVAEIDFEELREKMSYLKQILTKTDESCENKQKTNFVTIYTDGACSGNPGAGGWGAILMHGDHKKEISGFDKLTTNNQMELTAVIKALEMLKSPCTVELYSDSAYVVNSINQKWLDNWKSNGWVGADKKQIKNIELWQRLDELLGTHCVHFNKVKGHADNEFNNRCDALATGEISKNANENLN